MRKAPGNNDLSDNIQKEQGLDDNKEKDSNTVNKTEVKNAQAAGIGALGRSDENQIEKLIENEPGEEDNVY